MASTKLAYSSLLLLVAALCAGCKEQYSNWCENAPNHNCKNLDADTSCVSNDECAAPKSVCDLSGSKMCVQCIAPDQISACGGTTPACGDDHACRACAGHAECESKVCLPDGSCGDGATVAYVAPTGSGTACTKAMPCGTLAAAIATNKPLVKVGAGLVKDTATTTIDGKTVTILADPGAKLDRDGDGPILVVSSANADVKIYDLEITGASGMAGADGVGLVANGGTPKLTLTRVTVSDNKGIGISANGGSLTVTRSTITANAGGGISVTGVGTMFDIENNFITFNGVATGPTATQLGGALIQPNTSGSKFTFNTITFNQNDGSLYRAGVSCAGSMVAAQGNIIYKNTEGTTTSDATQSGGACQFGTSLVLGSTAGDLGFKSPTANPFDFHLTSASPATVVDAAGACTGIDFDGDMRPIGAACDLGADERAP